MDRLGRQIVVLVLLAGAVAVSLGRMEIGGHWPAAACTLLVVAYRWAPSRGVLFGALVPAAAWIADLPPWGGIIRAAILAITLVLIIRTLPTIERGDRTWIVLGLGIGSAAIAGFLASRLGMVATFADVLELLIVLTAFRAAAVALGMRNWAHGVMATLCTVPHLGGAAWLLAMSETAFGLLSLTAAPAQRSAWILGTPAVLVALL